MKLGLVTLAVCLAWLATPADASPIGNCALNDPSDTQQGVTCNLYQSLADGTPSQISNQIPLPLIVVAGFIGILEDSGSSTLDPMQWSDVLVFVNRGDGLATSIQLLANGCNVAAGNVSCFPAPGAIAVFVVRNPVDPTVFQAPAIVGTNTFNIFNGTDIPEPASLALGAIGFVLLIWRMRRNPMLP